MRRPRIYYVRYQFLDSCKIAGNGSCSFRSSSHGAKLVRGVQKLIAEKNNFITVSIETIVPISQLGGK